MGIDELSVAPGLVGRTKYIFSRLSKTELQPVLENALACGGIEEVKTMCPSLLTTITGKEFGVLPALVIELAFVWIITAIAFFPVCDSIIILNVSAAIKILLAVIVGVLGVYYVVKNGFVNDMLGFFDGVNEHGFAAAALYFAGSARYDDTAENSPAAQVASYDVLRYLLGHCASVEDLCGQMEHTYIVGMETKSSTPSSRNFSATAGSRMTDTPITGTWT